MTQRFKNLLHHIVYIASVQDGGGILVTLSEMKQQIKNSSDWVKIGAKKGNPALSIFPEDIQQELINGNYVIGKSYVFSDSDTKYKITNDGKVFLIFAKPINNKSIKPQNKSISKSFIDMQMLFIIVVIAVITLASIILIGPIFHALGW